MIDEAIDAPVNAIGILEAVHGPDPAEVFSKVLVLSFIHYGGVEGRY